MTKAKADFFRNEVLRVAVKNNKGHIAPSLSCIDILTVLLYKLHAGLDNIFLSKGHGCYGLYAMMEDLGKISKEDWENFRLDGCLDGFGSLGHGLPIAVGYAYSSKKHVYCIVGDGEMQEGSMWESLSFMHHHKVKNLTVIVDCNGLQAMDWIDNVLSQDLMSRFMGWGFTPVEVDGHDHDKLTETLGKKPHILLAKTIKGKGFKFMENKPEYHFRIPSQQEQHN